MYCNNFFRDPHLGRAFLDESTTEEPGYYSQDQQDLIAEFIQHYPEFRFTIPSERTKATPSPGDDFNPNDDTEIIHNTIDNLRCLYSNFKNISIQSKRCERIKFYLLLAHYLVIEARLSNLKDIADPMQAHRSSIAGGTITGVHVGSVSLSISPNTSTSGGASGKDAFYNFMKRTEYGKRYLASLGFNSSMIVINSHYPRGKMC